VSIQQSTDVHVVKLPCDLVAFEMISFHQRLSVR
jgi:hypothetical protein